MSHPKYYDDSYFTKSVFSAGDAKCPCLDDIIFVQFEDAGQMCAIGGWKPEVGRGRRVIVCATDHYPGGVRMFVGGDVDPSSSPKLRLITRPRV